MSLTTLKNCTITRIENIHNLAIVLHTEDEIFILGNADQNSGMLHTGITFLADTTESLDALLNKPILSVSSMVIKSNFNSKQAVKFHEIVIVTIESKVIGLRWESLNSKFSSLGVELQILGIDDTPDNDLKTVRQNLETVVQTFMLGQTFINTLSK